MLLQRVKHVYGDGLQVTWRHFPLEQINNVYGPGWRLWEQPEDYRSKGLWAFRAAEAAKQQGEGPFERLHLAILKARHENREDISDRSVLLGLAGQAGLDVRRFESDLADRALLARIGEEYNRGVNEHGIWGTPTLVFDGGQSAYLRMRPVPPEEESVRVFEELVSVVRDRPYLLEIKRPR